MADDTSTLTEAQHDEILGLIRASLAQVLQLQARGQIVPTASYTQGTVTSSDPTDGSVTVALDIDVVSGAVSPATVVGVTPVVGARVACVLVNHTMYVLGTLGPSQLLLAPTQDVSLGSDGHPFQLGTSDGLNSAFDENEVQARNNGKASPWTVNNQGGDVRLAGVLIVGSAGGAFTPSGATAYIGAFQNPNGWSSVGYAEALTSDGRVILNAIGSGSYVDLRAADATVMARFTTSAAPVTTTLTFPATLPTLSGSPAVLVGSAFQLAKQSSASLYKRDIADEDRARLADAARQFVPIRYRYTLPDDGIVDRAAAKRFSVGFRAEEVAAVLPEAGILIPHPDEPPLPYDDGWEPPDDAPDTPHPEHRTRPARTLDNTTLDPIVDALDPFAMIAALTALVHEQDATIRELGARVEALEGRP